MFVHLSFPLLLHAVRPESPIIRGAPLVILPIAINNTMLMNGLQMLRMKEGRENQVAVLHRARMSPSSPI